MTSKKVDLSIPNTPFPTRARGLVLGENGKISTKQIPDEIIDAIGTSGGTLDGKVDKDSVVAAAARLVQNKLLATDANPTLFIDGSGKIQWGAGGASALDASIYRQGASDLRTNSFFTADKRIWASAANSAATVEIGEAYANTAAIVFGGARDTNLYRSSAGVLSTDGSFGAAGQIGAGMPATAGRVQLGNVGPGAAAGISFGSTLDAGFYRGGAGIVATDNPFTAKQLRGRIGADLTVSGGAITVTNTMHRVTSPATPTITTINGGVDGAIVALFNYTGGTITVNTGGNVSVGTSIGVGAARVFLYNATNAIWHVSG